MDGFQNAISADILKLLVQGCIFIVDPPLWGVSGVWPKLCVVAQCCQHQAGHLIALWLCCILATRPSALVSKKLLWYYTARNHHQHHPLNGPYSSTTCTQDIHAQNTVFAGNPAPVHPQARGSGRRVSGGFTGFCCLESPTQRKRGAFGPSSTLPTLAEALGQHRGRRRA